MKTTHMRHLSPSRRIPVLSAVVGGLLLGLVGVEVPSAFAATASHSPPVGSIVVSNHSGTDRVVGCPTPAYTSVQAAVSAVAAGSTIYVCDGTYNESLTINQQLTLDGAQFGQDARTRAGPETIITGSSGISYASGATTGKINGFTLQGYAGGVGEIVASDVGSAWTFANNIIDVSNGGIYVNTNGLTAPAKTTINQNQFVQSTPSAAGSGDFGQAVLLWANTANNVTIANNSFKDLSGPGAAINTTGDGQCGATPNTADFANDLRIRGNSFVDNGTPFTNGSGSGFIDENFLALFCTTNATVSGNTVTITDAGDVNAASPIYLGGGDWSTTVSKNILTGNGASNASGVVLNSDFYPSGTGGHITTNTVSGFGYGVHVRAGEFGAPGGNTPAYFTISSNSVTNSTSYGIAVNQGLYGTISQNSVSGSGTFDCFDATGPGGPRTAGTYNTWSHDTCGTSSPAGL